MSLALLFDLEDAVSDAVGPPKEGQQAYCLDT